MPPPTLRRTLVLAGALLPLLAAFADAADRPYGISKRVAWTTSRLTGSPDPPPPYSIEPAFPGLKFDHPVILTSAPGTERLFVAELKGRIFSFANRPDATAELAVDLMKSIDGMEQLYGLTFHPDFARNRRCFVCYVKKADLPDGTVVSEISVSRDDPPKFDTSSERVILTWRSGGHNGGCIKFGLDGYLYISAGDAAGAFPPDSRRNGQDIGTLPSTLMRIDVDRRDGDRPYAIPEDNPFVDRPGARGEVWAYGFRNPWKIAVDPTDGAVWIGDVGWEMFEMIYRVEKGGNYGWSVVEASQSVHPEFTRGPTPILPPTVAHSHTESRSISGGAVYTGKRLEKLTGAYVYGDYVTGKIWGVRHDGQRLTWLKELVDTPLQIICFGTDHAGELYTLGYNVGTIHRLVEADTSAVNRDFPKKLSDTGLFASTRDHRPAAGVIRYSINAEAWADHTISSRFIALPGTSKLEVYKSSNQQIGFIAGMWKFPKDGVLVKTISLELKQGDPKSRRRLETQMLHFDGDAWQGYNYIWNDEGTDAVLAGHDGSDTTFTVIDPDAPGGRRRLRWHHAGRTECKLCHSTRGGSIYGFTVEQLNRDHDYGQVTDSQLRTLSHIGLFAESLPEKPGRMLDPGQADLPLEPRARAWLHVNCGHCHRRGGGGTSAMDIRYEYPLSRTNLLGARPTQGTFGMLAARVMAPGDPYRSVMLYRIAKHGRGRMPHFGSQIVDPAGVRLIHDWIASLSPKLAPAGGGDDTARQVRQENAALVARLRQPDLAPAGRTATINQLLASTSGALQLLLAVDHPKRPLPAAVRDLAVRSGGRHADIQVRDLFERFLPDDQRLLRLGTVIRPQQILDLAGDAGRGRTLFVKSAGVQCRNCHRVGDQGQQLGPDLDGIAKKYQPAALLETILEPSKKIEPKYLAYLVETVQGRVHTGLLVSRSDTEIVLRDPARKTIRIPAGDVELIVPQRKSLMPELLLKDMTAQQVADLLAFLRTLKEPPK